MRTTRQKLQNAPAALLAAALVFLVCLSPIVAQADDKDTDTPFKDFAGWWSGEGRIGLKDKKSEAIRCRATYFISDDGQDLTQNLRCSTQNFKVEVKSKVRHENGKLKGQWNEKIYNVSGAITGTADKKGLVLFVRGGDLRANMHLLTKGNRQIIEIHFEGIEVVGVSILMKKGS